MNSWEIYVHPTEDVALVRFPDPQNSIEEQYVLDYSNPIFAGTSEELVGRRVTCKGYGWTGTVESEATRLRQAEMLVTRVGYPACPLLQDCQFHAHGYYMPANELGQVQWYGDSGGPCFVEVSGGLQIAGIGHMSMRDPVVANAVSGHWQAGADWFREWLYATTRTIAAQPCTISGLTVTPSSTSVEVRWTTSAPASSEEDRLWEETSPSNYRPGGCAFGLCRAMFTEHRATFAGLTPGTAYRGRVGGKCKAAANALAPVTVTQGVSFRTLP